MRAAVASEAGGVTGANAGDVLRFDFVRFFDVRARTLPSPTSAETSSIQRTRLPARRDGILIGCFGMAISRPTSGNSHARALHSETGEANEGSITKRWDDSANRNAGTSVWTDILTTREWHDHADTGGHGRGLMLCQNVTLKPPLVTTFVPAAPVPDVATAVVAEPDERDWKVVTNRAGAHTRAPRRYPRRLRSARRGQA